jgi:hypothetical protein
MDFLLDALEEIAGEVFGSVATLLSLDLDIVFVDTSSTYFEAEGPNQLPSSPSPQPMMGSPARSRLVPGDSGTPRTPAMTCRRW